MRHTTWKHAALGCLVVMGLAGCTTSPLGRSQLSLFSADKLDQMGQQSFETYQKKLPEVQGRTRQYVECVADAITEQVNSKDAPKKWNLAVFKSDQANAFALPGGYIGVYSGLLNVAENQDQLAAVLGHEVSHVLAHHANERVSTQSITQSGLSVVQAVAGQGGEQLATLLGAGAQYGVLLPFSRKQESEADLLGLDLMAKAGFNPQASIALWNNMKASGGQQPPEWMSTHPGNDHRIQDLQGRMASAQALYQQAKKAGRTPNCNRFRP
ncbi:M48 family metallopeptidase [Larsenimonas rhizosphaerae]|uniref:M48 family metallopeptidase n=1 Tax=Larsenimonas rhizosphaerae TaxID=2944682 RepID=A0AA41ZI10_9GAMM|nr:M48 family metallopeptidase [Larsenimonas rhizosphaerae]MCM2129888.1 M48 family metallopeptidase [Larsenimonas rhizosphaerae]MCX2524549.1 M48 family metallopeptidase [Larsenimonas rhizosphaerae]